MSTLLKLDSNINLSRKRFYLKHQIIEQKLQQRKKNDFSMEIIQLFGSSITLALLEISLPLKVILELIF